MNMGAFGENFPYSNFHNMNMDWLVKIAKDFLDQYTNLQETISTGLQDIEDKTTEGLEELNILATNLESNLNEWYTTHSEDIANALTQALSDLNAWYTQHENYLNQTLQTNITLFESAAEEKATETIASIPQDYTSFVNVVKEMPIFSAESENPPLVDCNIIRVIPSEIVNDISYKIGLRAIGLSGSNILIAITKDCLDYGSPNYSRLLAQLYVATSTIPDGINEIVVPHVNGNATTDYRITLNCTKLKTLTSQNNTGVYFNIQYLNMEYEIARSSKGLYKYMDSLVYVPYGYLDKFSYVRNISIQVPGSISSHEFYLETFGYSTTYNRFYITLYDKTAGAEDCYSYKQYTSRPTNGIENIEFENYYNGSGDHYKFIISIDWSLYNTSYYYELATSNAPIIHPINSNFAKTYSGACVVKGTIYLDSEITLFPNQHLIGDECKIICTPNAKINMADNTTIEGIEFSGPWTPTRTHGDGTTYTQYGYVPLISMSDLSTGDTDALFGENNNITDSFIYISDNDSNVCISNCIFTGFDKPVIYSGGQYHTEEYSPCIEKCHFIDCRLGIAVKGQFQRLIGNEYLRCVIGTYLKGGNSNQIGEEYKCCDCGIYFPSDAESHNEITAVHICHAGLASMYIKTIGQGLGCTVTGCHIADGAVIGESVYNLLITSSRLDTYFKYTAGQRNTIALNNIRTAYLYGNDLYDVPSDTQITLNRGMGSTSDSEVNQ